jgi:hypothetical protein
MGLTIRRSVGEIVGSALCFATVLGSLVAIDERVRDHFSMVFSQASAGRGWISSGRDMADVLTQALHDQSIAHAPMLIFALVAVVLVIFMLRT